MAQVVLKNLTKKFDEVVAVDNMNTTIEDREFVVLGRPLRLRKDYNAADDCRP